MPVVCLIGSSRFKAKFHDIGAYLEKRGTLVLMMSFYQHADGVDVSPEERETLNRVDRARIDLADAVWVVDEKTWVCLKCNKPCVVEMIYAHERGYITRSSCCEGRWEWRPYIGADTQREIDYAIQQGKPIRYLSKEPIDG